MAFDRRHMLKMLAAAPFAAWAGTASAANERTALLLPDEPYPVNFDAASKIDPRYRRRLVPFNSSEPAGTIVIDTGQKFLYQVRENNTALRYGIGVGRDGFGWKGETTVRRKARWPTWVPPKEMREREPNLPVSMEGGPENPLGARALYLYEGGRDTLYRIHGTTQPWTIGKNVSSGCIRLLNQDVIDLFNRVPVGTKVIVR
ncbi:L,D-transpeptidase [Kaustia mangrovi]|uniref:L,D-transpeptidase n=1 Tax=Kaustia mangrovi TaxID=2593653 RepID=A0A7S8HCV0_9HYPH|nr:L,D-transpeptidase [Kaustia mangrovi]QPC43829.1 L,D-transpeptidase [Kaustia mangrovi]